LLSALVRALSNRADDVAMRAAFEDGVRRLMPARSVQLRDVASRWLGRSDLVRGAEAVALDVPLADSTSPAVLEATFDAGSGVGEWEAQLLGVAAHLAALVLEIERTRARLARAGLAVSSKPRPERAAPLIGSTPAMEALRSSINRVAGTDFTVLLEGESGVGKELVARQIHDRSWRRQGPFVAVNCAALVETLLEAELFGIEDRTATGVRGRRGKFECADGGTLFLDEVSDLSLSAQAKLLRAIQDLTIERVGGNTSHRVDIRIIAATNRTLRGLVERRAFRPDLYYRLSGVDVRVPTLRERRADIPVLARHFLDRHQTTRTLRLSPVATDALVAYDWPGNVRELERLMERAVAMAEGEVLDLHDLPAAVRGDWAAAVVPSMNHQETLRVWAGRYARLVLERSNGNKRAACRILDISYHTLRTYVRIGAQDDDNEPTASAAKAAESQPAESQPAESQPAE
jgi:transcriptional regulator with PAS, ATPase and Fis domain